MIKGFFEFLAPLLIITWVVFNIARFTRVLQVMRQFSKPVIILVSIVITFYFFDGLSLAEYLLSFNAIFSVGNIVFFVVILWKQFGLKPLLSSKDLLWFSIWNMTVSICLFASSLGSLGFDVYSLGYGFSAWFGIILFLTIILFLLRSPLAYIFIAYIVAFDLRLLHSENFFDYITDGLLFLISVIIVIFSSIKFIVLKYKERQV